MSCTIASHNITKTDEIAWRALRYVGRQVTSADEYGPLVVLELRDCTCGSTIAKDITEEK